VITNEGYAYGGGILSLGAFLISGCVFRANAAYKAGGGISCNGNFIPQTIVNCQFIGNTIIGGESGYGGGGIRFNGATNIIIRNCYIGQNTAYGISYLGAGIFGELGLIDGCQIVSNVSYSSYGGAGMVFYDSSYYRPATMRNCLIAYNSSTGTAGGLVSLLGARTIENCTIVSNRAGSYGGCQFGGSSAGSTSTVVNSIIYFNEGATSSNVYFGANGFAFFTNSCIGPTNGLSGANNTGLDPRLVNRDNGDFRLRQGSPCINAGINSSWMTDATDLDGHRRLDRYSRIVDMGCYEYLFGGSMYIGF
jgi:hypothetical protein